LYGRLTQGDAITDLPALGRVDAARHTDAILDRIMVPLIMHRLGLPRSDVELLLADAKLPVIDITYRLIADHVDRADIARLIGWP
jgi:hypothetical protein